MPTTPEYPALVTPLTGEELVAVWQNGKQRSGTFGQISQPALDASAEAKQYAQDAADTANAVMTYVTPYTVAQAAAATVSNIFGGLTTVGFGVAGDGGNALYRRVASQPIHPGCFRTTDRYLPNGTTDATNGGWWELVPERGQISVLAFGADRTGTAASDAAFQAAFAMFAAYRTAWAYADALSNMAILVPPGQYLLTQSESLIPSTYTTKTTGYVLRGTDRSLCNIIFAPTSGSKVLAYNQAFLFSRMEDLTFVGTARDQIFYRADMTSNNQQGWTFNRIHWIGTWGKGYFLTGTNNNSEYYWDDCGVGGEMGQFLYTPPANGSPAGSDQFLNYRFSRCGLGPTAQIGGTAGTFTGSITGGVLTVTAVTSGTLAAGQTIATPAGAALFVNRITGQQDRVVILNQLTGTAGGVGTYTVINCTGTVASGTLANLTNDGNCIIDMATGGHVSFHTCDFSGFQSGLLFQLRGTSHAYGVCQFSTSKCRYELKSAQTAVGYVEWAQGNVVSDQDDYSSQANVYYNADGTPPIVWYLASTNTAGPEWQFRTGQLIGRISVSHGPNDFEVRRNIKILDSDHAQLMDVFDMLVWPASVNDYGAPCVEFSGVRSKAGRVSGNTAWAASTAYTLGQIVMANNGLSLYKCTTAGTSGAASASVTGSISGTTLTVSATASGTISIGQKVTAKSAAVVVASISSGSTTVTVSSVTSGTLEVGQYVGASGIASGVKIASFGTFNGSTGTIILTAAPTTTSSAATLTCNAASPVLEDTIITAGSGTSWTVSRSQTVTSRAMTLTGGPQSAATSIPDGTAVWAFYGNEGRDYFNDAVAISPNFQGMSARPATKRRIAEFGNQLPKVGAAAPEIILPPNALITGAYVIVPSGAVSSYNPADWLIECDDGTVILAAYGQFAAQGLQAGATGLAIAIGTSMQRRKIRLLPGGAGGGNTDQYIATGRAWVEYIV